jgi:uncharacterized delta-60 repeat protein
MYTTDAPGSTNYCNSPAPLRWGTEGKVVKVIRRFILCLLSAAGLVAALVGPASATPGQLDPTFGLAGTGLVRTDITPKGDIGIGEVIQPDDKIVAVGQAGAPNPKFSVVRYNADGTIDTSFGGGDGIVQTDIGPYTDAAVSAVVQGDGKIVVAGSAGVNGPNARFAVVRYNADGTIDTSFGGGDGIVTVDVSLHDDLATGVGLLSDGTIVVAGGAAEDTANADFAAVALNGTNGSLDTSFGGTGKVRTDINSGSYDVGNSTVVVNADKVYEGGWTNKSGVSRFAVVSYNANGTLNASFGADGKVATDMASGNEYISGLALDGSGNIVAAGQVKANFTNSQAALARYTPAGVLDTTFNSTGKVITDYGPFGDGAFGVAIDGSGNIVTAGAIGIGGANPRFAVCRYLSTGALDSTFGTGGKVFTDFGPYQDVADIVGIQSTGRIVAVGWSGRGSGNSKFALAGYEAA